MDGYAFLSHKVEQSTVCPKTAESIQLCHILDRNVSGLLFDFRIVFVHDNGRKLQRVVPALHDARIEQIETSFHSSSSISLI